MTTPMLPFDAPVSPSLPRKRGQVPKSSVLAYQATNKHTRIAEVLHLIGCFQFHAPTSAEMAQLLDIAWRNTGIMRSKTDAVLFVRRGLSDAKAKGLVVYAGMRKCRVCQRVCQTWKVATR